MLGAINKEKLAVDIQPVEAADAPAAVTAFTAETAIEETATARVETITEVITPISTLPESHPVNPNAREVLALVKTKSQLHDRQYRRRPACRCPRHACQHADDHHNNNAPDAQRRRLTWPQTALPLRTAPTALQGPGRVLLQSGKIYRLS